MAGEKERVDGYLATVARLEPDIHPIDATAFYASAAISLKRIADAIDAHSPARGKDIEMAARIIALHFNDDMGRAQRLMLDLLSSGFKVVPK